MQVRSHERWNVGGRFVRRQALRTCLAVAGSMVIVQAGLAQEAHDHAAHSKAMKQESKENKSSLRKELTELRLQVEALKLALEQKHAATSAAPKMKMGHDGTHEHGEQRATSMPSGKPSMKMRGMKMGGTKMGGMKMGGMKMSGKRMAAKAPEGPGTAASSRSSMMGRMGRTASKSLVVKRSNLPGFPGASHIYHIGASQHFLDVAASLSTPLTKDQVRRLAELHQSSELQQADIDRRIEEAEQGLWVLTAKASPDLGKIRAKVQEIARMQAERRINFIQSVGAAAGILTEKQRAELTGGEQKVDKN